MEELAMTTPLNTLSSKKLLVSPSMLASDFAALGAELKAIEAGGADMVHLDVMDAHFVPNLTIGPALIASLRKHSALPFDVHLMMTDPLPYIGAFAKAGSDHITFHIEADSDIAETLKAIHDAGLSAGLTLKPGTPVETLFPYLNDVEMVLVMTVEPGFGGQKFMADQLEKVRKLRAELDRTGNTACHIQVDGGLDSSNVEAAAAAGANVIVAGTSVFKHKNGIPCAIAELHQAQQVLNG